MKEFKVRGCENRGFYFKLFIHNTLSSLRDEWDKLPKISTPHGSKDVNAFTVKYFPAEKFCIGELHFVKNVSDDIISHEACHAAGHYILNKKYPTGADIEEEFCYNQQYFFKNIQKIILKNLNER